MITNVIDSKNVSYELDQLIGEGSQGYVFMLKDNDYIAKLYKKGTDESYTSLRIKFLRQLELDKGIFAIPEKSIVSPRVGYIARCAKGMVPIEFLKTPGNGDKMEWFQKTGGLAKRYQILLKLASALRTLHGMGLMYMDLSMKNVFVSASPQKAGMMLIDLDNLNYSGRSSENIFTPFYGAPEVVNGLQPNSTMSDCYSFAVMAYELFTWSHPLTSGQLVNEGEAELEEKALSGMMPWVEHSKDKSNARVNGLPTDLFVSKELQNLFKRTFEDGLNEPQLRPTIAEWYDTLKSSLDGLVKCEHCNIHFPYANFTKCPLCDQAPKRVLNIQVRRWDVDKIYNPETNNYINKGCLSEKVYTNIVLNSSSKKRIYAYHLLLPIEDRDTLLAEIEVNEYSPENLAKINVKTFNGYECRLCSSVNPKNSIKVKDGEALGINENENSFMFYFNDINISQRVITFSYT